MESLASAHSSLGMALPEQQHALGVEGDGGVPCALCYAPLSDEKTENDMPFTLGCAHTFHRLCIRRALVAARMAMEAGALRGDNGLRSICCPTCKRDATVECEFLTQNVVDDGPPDLRALSSVPSAQLEPATPREDATTQPPQAGSTLVDDGPPNLRAFASVSSPQPEPATNDEDMIGQASQAELTLVSSAFGIAFTGVKGRGATLCQDRVCASLDKVRDARTEGELLEAIWTKNLFENIGSNDSLYAEIQRFLDSVHEDTRCHRQISVDPGFTTALLVPLPFSVAAQQLALRHGAHSESFLLAMASNITRLEHHWTRLGADPPSPGVDVVATNAGPRAKAGVGKQEAGDAEPKHGGIRPLAVVKMESDDAGTLGVLPAGKRRRAKAGVGKQDGGDAEPKHGGIRPLAVVKMEPDDAGTPGVLPAGKRKRKQAPRDTAPGIEQPPALAEHPGIAPLAVAEQAPSEQWRAFLAMEPEIEKHLRLAEVDMALTTLTILRKRVEQALGWETGALLSHRKEFKAWVLEKIAEVDVADEKVAEDSDVFVASQRPCSAVIAWGSHSKARVCVAAVSIVHTISPPLAVLCMGSASSKKSFVCQLSKDMMLNSSWAPPEIRDGSVFMVEATSKGIRTCILNTDRCSATTDEIVNTFPTPWSESKQAGAQVHFLSRSKLCTYTQGEQDDVVTANGPIHLRGYAFQLKGFGQCEAVEWVWRPTPNGWQKRPSVSISPDHNPLDEDVNADYSTGLWQRVHDDQFRGPYQTPVHLHLDVYALAAFRTVRRAVTDWLETKGRSGINRYFKVKLEFFFSDLLRLTLFNMRLAQCLERMCTEVSMPGGRVAANLWEFTAGLHWWRRQIALHAGFYRFVGERSAAAGSSTKPDDALAAALVGAPPPGSDRPAPVGTDGLQAAIMTNAKFAGDSAYQTSTIFQWVRRCRHCPTGKAAAQAVIKAIEDLAEVGLLVLDTTAKKRPGPQVKSYRKAAWSDFQDSDNARAACEKLGLARTNFD